MKLNKIIRKYQNILVKRVSVIVVGLTLTSCGADSLVDIQNDLAGGEDVNLNLSLNDDGDLVIGISDESDNSTEVTPAFPLPEMVDIEAGCFDIGSPMDEPLRSTDESPQLNICVDGFRLGQFEVTFEQYDAFAIDTVRPLPDDEGFGRGDHPVINVDWSDATSYASWLSQQTGQNYRLPTEAEWEYAARAGSTTPFHTGQIITSDQANFQARQSFNGSPIGEFRGQTLPVGSLSSNAFGLFDIHGNVQEWTCSPFVGDYRSSNEPQTCESGNQGRRALRGGSWASVARDIRSARRNNSFTSLQTIATGFRVLQE